MFTSNSLSPAGDTLDYNLPLLTQGALAALSLLGVSSMSGNSFLLYPAAGTLLYSAYTGLPVRRLAAAFRELDITRLIGWVGGLVAGFLAAAFLADAGGLLSVLGSLAFAVLVGVIGVGACTLIVRLLAGCGTWTARAVVKGYTDASLYLRVLWVSAFR